MSLFAANQSLVDSSEVFSCDLTAHGKSARHTLREPLCRGDHRDHSLQSPLDQVIHKVAPGIAPTTAWCSSPAKKTLNANALADILYEAGPAAKCCRC